MENEITIWLEGHITPSLNKLLRKHWATRKRDRLALGKLIWYSFLMQNSRPDLDAPIILLRKCRLTISSYRKSLLDPDNFIGGLKEMVDVLKNIRLIYDDSPQYLDLVANQHLSKNKKGTEIRIT